MATLEELVAQRDTLEAEIAEIDAEHAGERFPEEVRERWNQKNTELDETRATIKELEVRKARVTANGEKPDSIEKPEFSVSRSKTENIYDLASVRRDFNDPSVEGRELRERAKRVIEQSQFPHPRAKREVVQEHIERLIETVDTENGSLSRHMLVTSSPAYKRAFGKYLMGKYLTGEEERALSLTGSAGGFAVPFELDPTIIPTSNLAINPYRAIARVEQITVDEWRGVSSAGITAAYAAEATAAGDNAPTLAQPTISTEKAQAFVPYSIEIGMDWGSLQAEMARLLQDSKDELEATKFTLGSGTNEPFGVITGATTVYTAADSDSLVVADIYGLENALGPRFRPMASFVMNGITANRIRQFDTQGGASIWVDNLGLGLISNQVPTPGQLQSRLLGHAAYEASAMASALTTGQLIAVFGDFRYFCVVDRIGLTVETIPHLFDVTNNRPTGQRGLYAYWRNSSKVLDANAFRTLKMA